MSEELKHAVNEALTLYLRLIERRQATDAVLDAIEPLQPQWRKFDLNDSDTWPDEGQLCWIAISHGDRARSHQLVAEWIGGYASHPHRLCLVQRGVAMSRSMDFLSGFMFELVKAEDVATGDLYANGATVREVIHGPSVFEDWNVAADEVVLSWGKSGSLKCKADSGIVVGRNYRGQTMIDPYVQKRLDDVASDVTHPNSLTKVGTNA